MPLLTDVDIERVVITGSSGLVGSALSVFLSQANHRVDRLVRRSPQPETHEINWDPARGKIDANSLEGVDGVVNLAGASIVEGRWTRARKQLLHNSRIESTQLLCKALAGLKNKPKVLISASGTGYYGNRDTEVLTEDSQSGGGFLAELSKQWEAATEPARQAGIRVINLRMGMVLAKAGGALAQMLPPFKLGLGGVIGSGRQYISWIALSDLLRVIEYSLHTATLSGPVNTVAPNPIPNAEFVRTLGKVLRRPTICALPAVAVRLRYGEMGQVMLLEGAKVLPAKLEASGFKFQQPILEEALRSELNSPTR